MPTFSELGLSPEILQAVTDLGYEEPTPIQSAAIPVLMSGSDIIAQAQTGTGKTAAFAIPLVERIDGRSRNVQAVVILPTRELAVQVAEAVHALGRPRGISVLPIYGGQPYDRQLRALRAGVQVVVGTPGRMLDHLRRGTLNLDHVKFIALDEADEMLNMGFLEDIEFILSQLPEERQVAMFSATVPARIDNLARRYLRNAEHIAIQQETQTVPLTRQFWYQTPYRGKVDVLTRILDFETPGSAIIFCRTKREVDMLVEALEARGYASAAIHGDISQAQREQHLRAFRENRVEILVATDVAARGLDIPDVSHVINYDIPDDADAYVHRVGRTGRMGKKGDAITLVTPREIGLLRLIERQTRQKMKPLQLATPADIAARRRDILVETLRQVLTSGDGSRHRALVESLAADHDPLDVAAAAIQLAVSSRDGRTDPSIAQPDEKGSPMPAQPQEQGMVRLFMNAGRKHGLRPPVLLEVFSNQVGIEPAAVGTMDLYDTFAFVEVRPAAARRLTEGANVTFNGAQVQFKKAFSKRG